MWYKHWHQILSHLSGNMPWFKSLTTDEHKINAVGGLNIWRFEEIIHKVIHIYEDSLTGSYISLLHIKNQKYEIPS